jgi:hypothetical protein
MDSERNGKKLLRLVYIDLTMGENGRLGSHFLSMSQTQNLFLLEWCHWQYNMTIYTNYSE